MKVTRILRTSTAARTTFVRTSPLLLSTRSPRIRPPPPSRACRCFTSTFSPRRSYSTGELTNEQYQSISDSTMDRLTEYLEELVESNPTSSWDIEYSSGVLTLNLANNGTYVINKQPPNKQIWLSSPLSGPKRYDWDPKERVWFYGRDDTLLRDLLNEELRVLMSNEHVDIDLAEGEDPDP